MAVIGLTGGVATGKTLVTDYLASRGVAVVDADLLAREVVRPGESAWEAIREVFGEGYFHEDGRLNRSKLAGLVFRDGARRRELEKIIHPRVFDLAWKRIRELQGRSKDSLIVFAVPLLFETGHDKEVDRVVVVYADEETQRQRLMQRDGLSRAEADARISAQMPIERKRAAADHVIENTGSVRNALEQADDLLRTLLPPEGV